MKIYTTTAGFPYDLCKVCVRTVPFSRRKNRRVIVKNVNTYASVTFAFRRVYDARTMSKSPFQCSLRRETLRSSYGFTGIVASTILFVCLFCCFTSQVNSYGHCGTVSSPNHTFSWAGLNKRLTSNSCTYFRL